MPADIEQESEKIFESAYGKNIQNVLKKIINKKVTSFTSGNSGYILLLDDNSYIVSYIEAKNKKLDLLIKEGTPIKSDIELINSKLFGDASLPLSGNLPYASEYNNKNEELKNTIGKKIIGMALGENTFSLGFPDGMELEAMLVKDDSGKDSLRIFWEQW
ncbi:hypothetical protein A2272_06310 [Candidatus Peregrinibacteria bacterium RIFOXYA12_FULL_33_12]|nr:MAG: hypothetical protein A2272_06310 [Candidatus Peregrinibacteria bacterium RIFOXYA12_FULL_33_12]